VWRKHTVIRHCQSEGRFATIVYDLAREGQSDPHRFTAVAFNGINAMADPKRDLLKRKRLSLVLCWPAWATHA
jgi:hypothetical protein